MGVTQGGRNTEDQASHRQFNHKTASFQSPSLSRAIWKPALVTNDKSTGKKAGFQLALRKSFAWLKWRRRSTQNATANIAIVTKTSLSHVSLYNTDEISCLQTGTTYQGTIDIGGTHELDGVGRFY